MPLHPQAKKFLDFLDSLDRIPIHTLSPERNRTGMDLLMKKTSLPPEEVADVEDRMIPGPDGEIKVRIYTPAAGGPLPVLVFFHGGGWVLGDLESVDGPLRALTNRAPALVVSVDYRLAPEYKFPTAVDDCYFATKWVWEHARELGGDPGRIAVGGESAGGNLAAVVSLLACDRKMPQLARQLLLYPVTDISRFYASEDKYDGCFISKADMRYFEAHYLRTEEDRQHMLASPLLAPGLAGLPPAFVVTAGYDPLLDQGRVYAERLGKEGVAVSYHCFEDMIHGFFGFAGIMDRGKELIELMADFISAR